MSLGVWHLAANHRHFAVRRCPDSGWFPVGHRDAHYCPHDTSAPGSGGSVQKRVESLDAGLRRFPWALLRASLVLRFQRLTTYPIPHDGWSESCFTQDGGEGVARLAAANGQEKTVSISSATLRRTGLTCYGILLLVCASLAQQRTKPSGVGIPSAWDNRHVAVRGLPEVETSSDPRVLANVYARTIANRTEPGGRTRVHLPPGRKRSKSAPKRDWAVSLGRGRVAPNMSPAKFSFYINSSVTVDNCNSDFVVFALDTPGTATQANLVALNNLYSGTTPDDGLCNPFTQGTNSATVFWAYNTSTATCGGNQCANAGNMTSPSLSFDETGSKVVFVESTSDGSAVCPGRIGTGPCSIFHVLTWKAHEGAVGAPAVPGLGGSQASLTSITYASAPNTTSSAWIDYANDVAYVGADDGKLYRITGVFSGTPTLDTAFTMQVASGLVQLSPPVQIAGSFDQNPFNVVLVGDAQGNLWAVDALNRSILGPFTAPTTPTPVVVGGHAVGTFTPGVLDAPIVYYDPSIDPRHLSAFSTSGSSANANASVSGKAAIVEALVELNPAPQLSTFDDIAEVSLGIGATVGQPINLHAPALSNVFYDSPLSGALHACGTAAAQPSPQLYRIGFAYSLAAPRDLVPVLDGSKVSSTAIATSTSNAECSPLTEFPNPNLAPSDILFFGVSGNVAKAFNWDITGALASGPMVAGGVSEPGGTSGIIGDNVQLTGGMGTSQGSSIYFSTLAPSNNCGANTFCAVKLRQLDLN